MTQKPKQTAGGLIRSILFQSTGYRVMLIVFSALGAAMTCACAFLGAYIGDEDYFTSVFFLVLAYYLPNFMVLLSFSLMGSSRFLYAAPMAKKAITVGLPLLGAAICAVQTVLAVGTTAVGLTLGLTDGNRMSDTLAVCAATSFLLLLCYALYQVGGAGFLGLAFGILMFVFSIGTEVTIPGSALDRLCRYGFGLPTWLSAILLVAAFAVGIPLSVAIAKKCYRRRSSRAMVGLPPVN
ncbi:MAG: hypothetical protein NC084_01390 [Bacteroides sp.]|nr:hypothetical protein [Eubacterium sp.]MCM1417763.1 hypothetical protein [Roseburia sp.]MCM1461346.1 hypothetical protein [Bacteroides sp.]